MTPLWKYTVLGAWIWLIVALVAAHAFREGWFEALRLSGCAL